MSTQIGPRHEREPLPARPNLEHLKKQAKDLLDRARDGDAEARAEFEAVARPHSARAADYRLLTLASAQHVVARNYGFASWVLLKDEVLRRSAEHLRQQGLPQERERRLALLEQAIRQHDFEAVRVLLELDTTLANGGGDCSPLGLALERDLPEFVDLLVDAGAPIGAPSSYPHNDLSWAITVGSLRAARRLVARGAQADLWCASGLGDVERMRSFFDEAGRPLPGASLHGATRYDESGQELPKPPSDPIEVISDALYIACRNGQFEAAQFLLDRGANPAFEGYVRAPSLHWAAASGNRALVELLLERGANPDQKDGRQRSYRQFAIRQPIEWSWAKGVKNALTIDPSLLEERDATWGPPLHAAAAQGLDEHVEILLEAGADPLGLDHAGRTALECAKLAPQSDAASRVVALLEAAGAR